MSDRSAQSGLPIRRFGIRLPCAALALGLTVGCSDTKSETGPKGDTVEVELALVLGFSGTAADLTISMDRASDLALEALNEHSEASGYRFKLRRYDTQYTVEGTLAATQKLETSYVFGPTSLFGAELMLETILPAGGLLFSPLAEGVTEVERGKSLFRTSAPVDGTIGSTRLVGHIRDSGLHRVVSFGSEQEEEDSDVSTARLRFAAAWDEANLDAEFSHREVVTPFEGTSELAPLVADALSSSPDVLVLNTEDREQGLALLLAGNALGYEGLWYVPNVLGSPQVVSVLGPDLGDRLRYANPRPRNGSSGFADYVARYEAGFDEAPTGTYQSVGFYDSILLCGLAIIAAGHEDPALVSDAVFRLANEPGDPFEADELGAAISALVAGTDINFEGLTGDLELDADGDVVATDYGIYATLDGVVTEQPATP